MNEFIDFYALLGISPQASGVAIKKALRKRAMQFHPDKPGGSEEIMKLLNQAQQILTDPDKKNLYDKEYYVSRQQTQSKKPTIRGRYAASAQIVRTHDLQNMIEITAGGFVPGNIGLYDRMTGRATKSLKFLDTFHIDRYLVTNLQYQTFIASKGYMTRMYWSDEGWAWRNSHNVSKPRFWNTGQYFSGEAFPDHPVVGVSWYEAEAYSRWASLKLPSEDQWEKAARGAAPDCRHYPWGNDSQNCLKANYKGCIGGPSKVGSCPNGCSPYGVEDMAGNVSEWTSSWFRKRGTILPDRDNPFGGGFKIIKGGNWASGPEKLRIGHRAFAPLYEQSETIGFRCIKESS